MEQHVTGRGFLPSGGTLRHMWSASDTVFTEITPALLSLLAPCIGTASLIALGRRRCFCTLGDERVLPRGDQAERPRADGSRCWELSEKTSYLRDSRTTILVRPLKLHGRVSEGMC